MNSDIAKRILLITFVVNPPTHTLLELLSNLIFDFSNIASLSSPILSCEFTELKNFSVSIARNIVVLQFFLKLFWPSQFHLNKINGRFLSLSEVSLIHALYLNHQRNKVQKKHEAQPNLKKVYNYINFIAISLHVPQ